MKLTSNKHEIRAIITILDASDDLSAFLLGKLKSTFFGFDATKEIYKRLMNLIKAGKALPSRDLLKDDPALSESARSLLASKIEPLDNGDDIQSLLQVLSNYRRLRSIHKGVSEAMEVFQSDDIDSETIDSTVRVLDGYVKDALTSDDADAIRTIGKGGNSKKIIDSILDPTSKKFIPTGIQAFDRTNGGWRRGGLITLAANSGGGKSITALQIAINQYRLGFNVIYVSMEMSEEEVYERLLSNISAVEFNKILLKKLSIQQEKNIRKAWKQFNKVEEDSEKYFKIWVPTSSVSLSNIINTISPFKPDIVYIDMVNLLEPEDKKVQNQPQQLADMTRYGKVAANALDIVLVVLAQLNEEDKVKYARAIVENSNNVWTWFLGEKEKETHFFTIKQAKARNQQTFDIPMVEDLAHMSISGRDLSEENTSDNGDEDDGCA